MLQQKAVYTQSITTLNGLTTIPYLTLSNLAKRYPAWHTDIQTLLDCKNNYQHWKVPQSLLHSHQICQFIFHAAFSLGAQQINASHSKLHYYHQLPEYAKKCLRAIYVVTQGFSCLSLSSLTQIYIALPQSSIYSTMGVQIFFADESCFKHDCIMLEMLLGYYLYQNKNKLASHDFECLKELLSKSKTAIFDAIKLFQRIPELIDKNYETLLDSIIGVELHATSASNTSLLAIAAQPTANNQPDTQYANINQIRNYLLKQVTNPGLRTYVSSTVPEKIEFAAMQDSITAGPPEITYWCCGLFKSSSPSELSATESAVLRIIRFANSSNWVSCLLNYIKTPLVSVGNTDVSETTPLLNNA
jgi:hypothetical protein